MQELNAQGTEVSALQTFDRAHTKATRALDITTSNGVARDLAERNMPLEIGADLYHGGKLTMDCALAKTPQATQQRLTQQMMSEINQVADALDDEFPTS